MNRMTALVDHLCCQIVSHDKRITALEKEYGFIKDMFADVGQWLDSIGSNLREKVKVFGRQFAEEESGVGEQRPATERRKRTRLV